MTEAKPPLPQAVWDAVSDKSRLDVLESLEVAESTGDPDFDRLTRLAADIFGMPIALVTLVDVERQWFRACVGVAERETPVGVSFCSHALADRKTQVTIIPDATLDERFADNPLVTGPHHVRFYAGAPLTVHGQRLGTVCVLDTRPHYDVTEAQLERLVDLAALAGTMFELKDEARVRSRATAALVREEWRHALTLEAGKVGSWVWDLRTGEVTGNDLLRRMFRLPSEGTISGNMLLDAIDPEDRARVDKALERAFNGEADYFEEFRVANDGRWLMGRGRVYQRDAEGRPLVLMGINLDITDDHEAAQRTRLLLRELNHRVKNTLAIILSLARQTMQQRGEPHRLLASFTGRLRTVTDAHALLADRDWATISLADLVKREIASNAPGMVAARFVINGEDVPLPADHALGLGIVLHELLSNACEHGALTSAQGKVLLAWKRDEQGLEMTWEEVDGPRIAEPPRRGFGTRLIARSLDKILGSEVSLDFRTSGATARILMPLAD